jgi:hypothetical protein
MKAARNQERWCPTGNHFRPLGAFCLKAGKLARDCARCEAERAGHARRQAVEPPGIFDGVDIDRIHYKLSAIARRPR